MQKQSKILTILFIPAPTRKQISLLANYPFFYSYPKGLLIAFKLKTISDEVPSEQNNPEQQTNDADDISKTDQQNPSEIAAEESGKKISENDENDKENSEVSEGKGTEGEEKSKETDRKNSATPDKDNKFVVLRGDLKVVFEKFGTVKVIGFSPFLWLGLVSFVLFLSILHLCAHYIYHFLLLEFHELLK